MKNQLEHLGSSSRDVEAGILHHRGCSVTPLPGSLNVHDAALAG